MNREKSLISILMLLLFLCAVPLLYLVRNYNSSRMKTNNGLLQDLKERKPRTAVTLTTIPRRIGKLEQTLQSIFSQTILPDIIQINLPKVFLRTGATYNDIDNYPFLKHPLIRLYRCEDTGPSTKLLPTLKTETDPDTFVIVIDDDTIYPPTMIEIMLNITLAAPNYALVGHPGDILLSNQKTDFEPLTGFNLPPYYQNLCCVRMFEAFGAVGYRRGMFNHDEMSIDQYMKIALLDANCFRSDDLLFSNYLILHHIQGLDLSSLIHVRQLTHGFEGGIDGALHRLNYYIGHPYSNCSDYLRRHGIGKLTFKPLEKRLANP
jgi:hypothetical protein